MSDHRDARLWEALQRYLEGGPEVRDAAYVEFLRLWNENRAALSQATKREGDSPVTDLASTTERVTHGRHCTCSACARYDWTEPGLAPCGMHGKDCPPVYAPLGAPGDLVGGSTTERVERLIEDLYDVRARTSTNSPGFAAITTTVRLLTAQDRVVQAARLFANAHGAEAGAHHRARLLAALADLDALEKS